ncbi:hypothetical protein [Lysobacter sp. Root494]|uniref:hypothetical protein n=1 Tax=Lysobacter sp. Root494 TaxID=1736549 RepID=UPI0006F70275|nr:hypothetical protein [Lysobacter sp. Root494]KQY54810.1 hypothetical protein ASD14_01095 [Lysobacter sp. Root494]
MAVKRARIGFLLQPWAGLIAGVAGWFAHHQIIGDALHFHCPAGNPASAVVVGIAVIVFVALAALWSRAVLREDAVAVVEEGEAPPRGPAPRRKRASPRDEGAREEPAREPLRRSAGSRAFAARLSLMAAALFALLVAVQTMAGVMLPGCPP